MNHRQTVRGETEPSHALVSGSFGQGNLGDEALLEAFLERHRSEYLSTLVLKAGLAADARPTEVTMPLPRLATGWRTWWGLSDRIQKRRLICKQMADGSREYVWLGGLLAHIHPHNRARYKELLWAISTCSRFRYYFGDVGDGFTESPVARKIVRLLDRIDARIAVRSEAAARILVEAGLRTKVHVGLDAVLYDRVVRWRIPFQRRAAATDIAAIIPCNCKPDFYQAAWLATARAAVRLGLRLRWISLCDPADLALCARLVERVRAEYPNHPQEIYGGNRAENGLSQAACCIATRYHGAIFALSQGVPTLAVPYTHKVRRLFRLLGMQDWLIEPEPSDTWSPFLDSDLVDKLRQLLAGHGRPDFAVLRQQAELHKQVLISFGAAYPEMIPVTDTPVAAAG